MKTAIVLGAGSESICAIDIAKKRGYYVIAFDGNPQAEGFLHADEAIVSDIRRADEVWKRLEKRPELILPVPIGRYLTTVGAVNDYYGLKGISEEAARNCTDKYRFHKKLSSQGLRDGQCLLIKEGILASRAVKEAEKLFKSEKSGRSFVIKPRYGSGSRGVFLAYSLADISDYLGQGDVTEDFVLESVFSGIEYGVDAAVYDGRLSLFLVREKLLTQPPYRQCVGYLSVDRQKETGIYREIGAYLQQVIEVLRIDHCLVHCDLMWDGGIPMVIELAGRPSGHNLHNLFTPLATGVSMIDQYITYIEDSRKVTHGKCNEVTRRLLIGYFDSEPCKLRCVPNDDMVRKQFGRKLLKYDCYLKPGVLQEVQDGHTLMQRGYYIFEDESKERLLKDREELLALVFSEKG